MLSDLKQVNNQLHNRLSHLNNMVEELDGFHGNLDNFDAWLCQAERDIDDIKKSVSRTDDWEHEVLQDFQVGICVGRSSMITSIY